LANVDNVQRDITVTIGGTAVNQTYTLDPSQTEYILYPGVVGGPVVITADNTNAKIIASLYELKRARPGIGWNGQSEMMGLPWGQLSDVNSYPYLFIAVP